MPDRRTETLDGVRGLAALSVFLFHAWLYGGKDPAWRPLLLELRIGLICFFVLSGFLLYRGFARAAAEQRGPVDLRRYARRRFLRIVPAYYAAIAGSVALLGPLAGRPGIRFPAESGLPLFALFAQNYSSATVLTLNPVTWTLCLEAAFYALLPVLGLFAYHVARGRARPQVIFALGLVAAGLTWHGLGMLAHWGQVGTKALPAYLPYFAAGILVALVAERRRRLGSSPLSRRATGWLALGALALVVGNGAWHELSPGPAHDLAIVILADLPAGAGFALLVAAAVFGTGPALGWLRLRWMTRLGRVSYGFYLWHLPLMLFVANTGLASRAFGPLAIVTFPLAVAAGTASWLLIERPLLRRGHSQPSRRLRSRDGKPGGDHGPLARRALDA